MGTPNNQKHRPRRDYWQELISQQQQSGFTVHAFCAQRGVTEGSFYNWRKQLRGGAPVGFALVEASGSDFSPKAPVERQCCEIGTEDARNPTVDYQAAIATPNR